MEQITYSDLKEEEKTLWTICKIELCVLLYTMVHISVLIDTSLFFPDQTCTYVINKYFGKCLPQKGQKIFFLNFNKSYSLGMYIDK